MTGIPKRSGGRDRKIKRLQGTDFFEPGAYVEARSRLYYLVYTVHAKGPDMNHRSISSELTEMNRTRSP